MPIKPSRQNILEETQVFKGSVEKLDATKNHQTGSQFLKQSITDAETEMNSPSPLAAISVANRSACCMLQNLVYTPILFNCFCFPYSASRGTPGRIFRKTSYMNFTFKKNP